jgi:hypothetical protein
MIDIPPVYLHTTTLDTTTLYTIKSQQTGDAQDERPKRDSIASGNNRLAWEKAIHGMGRGHASRRCLLGRLSRFVERRRAMLFGDTAACFSIHPLKRDRLVVGHGHRIRTPIVVTRLLHDAFVVTVLVGGCTIQRKRRRRCSGPVRNG